MFSLILLYLKWGVWGHWFSLPFFLCILYFCLSFYEILKNDYDQPDLHKWKYLPNIQVVCWNWLWWYCLPYFGSLLLWDLLWLLRWEVCQWSSGKGLCIKLCRSAYDWVIQSLTICLGKHIFLKQFNLFHRNEHFIME